MLGLLSSHARSLTLSPNFIHEARVSGRLWRKQGSGDGEKFRAGLLDELALN